MKVLTLDMFNTLCYSEEGSLVRIRELEADKAELEEHLNFLTEIIFVYLPNIDTRSFKSKKLAK